jgi:hypothetical protein
LYNKPNVNVTNVQQRHRKSAIKKKYHTVGTIPKSTRKTKKYHTVGTISKSTRKTKKNYTVGTIPKVDFGIVPTV